MNSFLQELKRRNVLKIAAAYGAGAWILVSIGDILFPILGAPTWGMKAFVLAAVLGLPFAALFAWVFELTPEGLKRSDEVTADESITRHTSQRLNYIVIGLLTVALAVSLFLNFSLTQDMAVAQPSVAVLPFASRGAHPDNAAFTDGVHDEILTMLANIGSLKVISRTSMLEYRDTTKNMRQIGEELGVTTVLEGAVQRAGDNIRINVQLIDAQTDEHLWAKTYDEELTAQNIFEIQSKISSAIAEALRATLTPQDQKRLAVGPTENLEAFTSFMAGKSALYARGLDNIKQARAHFENAIELDPNYAKAHAGLAAAIHLLWSNHFAISREEALALANESIETALSLSEDDPGIYAVLGLIRRGEAIDDHLKPSFSEAEAAFKKALELNPNQVQALMWYGGMLAGDEQYAAAKLLFERAMELDPLARIPRDNMLGLLSRLSKDQEAVDLALDTIEFLPDYAASYHFLSRHLQANGHLDEAMAWGEKAIAIDSDPLAWGQSSVLLREFGRVDRLSELAEGLPEEHPLYHIVQSFVSYSEGNVDGALARIEAMLTYMDEPPAFFIGFAAFMSLETGDCEKARRYFYQRHPELSGEQPLIRDRNYGSLPGIAYCLQKDMQPERATLLLNQALTYIEDVPRLGTRGYGILDAEIYALLGEPEKSIAALRNAVTEGFRSSYYFAFWPLEDNLFLESIKSDPEFDELVQIVNTDIARMLANVEVAERSGDWEPLLAAIKNETSLQ